MRNQDEYEYEYDPRRDGRARRAEYDGRRPPRRKKRRRFPFWTLPVILALLGALGYAYLYAQDQIAAYAQFQKTVAAVSGETFYPGVRIDGIDLGGKTMQEARQLLENHETAEMQGFEVFLTDGQQTWRIASDTMDLAWNTDMLLQGAYALGRSGTLEERYAAVKRLESMGAYYDSVYTYDKTQVREMCDALAAQFYVECIDARVVAFDVANRSFAFSDEQTGRRLDADALYETVIGQLDAGAQGVTIPLPIERVDPAVTRAQLESNYGLVTSFTTKTTENSNRNRNIQLAAEALNGQMLDANGGTISFNTCTGERTKEKGYKEAAAIAGGASVDEVGGGVCQVATTLFNALLRADCSIVKRYPHAWPANYVPRGEDATVDWPGVDLVMRNDSAAPLFIASWYENQRVTVEVYGLSLGEGVAIDLASETIYVDKVREEDTVYNYNPNLKVGAMNQIKKAHEGYRTQTYKIWYQDGQEVRREAFYTSDYRKINPTYEYNDGQGGLR